MQHVLLPCKMPWKKPPNFFSNRKVSKLPKPSLSITYHQRFNKSNLLVKNIGFRRNLTFLLYKCPDFQFFEPFEVDFCRFYSEK